MNWKQAIFMGGRIHRRNFFALGLLLVLAKWTLDSLLARAFDRPWTLANYWAGMQIQLIANAGAADRRFLAWMLAASVPFVWAGILLIVRRLRSTGLPLWLSILFFVPVINIIFFIVLSVLPGCDEQVLNAEILNTSDGPRIPLIQRFVTVMVCGGIGWAFTAIGVYGFGVYGVGLFVALPFCIGMMLALLQSRRGRANFYESVIMPILCMAFIALLLMLTAMEGAICLLMAAPIWLACSMIGGTVGYFISAYSREERVLASIVVVIALLVPVLMGAETWLRTSPRARAVRTTVQINAPPEEVWKNVIAFPALDEPKEFYFQLGVAYPTDAVIRGHGPRAVRRCNFSTGAFVEPIDVWDEPRLLKFSVKSNPPPLLEWSFYDQVDPPHLHGFLVSQAGQFHLTPMNRGKTLLEGTTWYHNDMNPAPYWNLWSDAIIHRIHERVLVHIKNLSEHETDMVQK